MKFTRLAALTAVCGAGLSVPASANHSWETYHWSIGSQPLQLEVVTSTSAYWEKEVVDAIADWHNPVNAGLPNSPDLVNLSRTVNTSIDRRKCSPIPGKVLVCNYAYGTRQWLGIASVWLSNGHISQATTKLNDSLYKPGSTYDTAAWRALVACQEIGHDFGLAHQNEAFSAPNLGSCMDYTNDADGGGAYGPDNMEPNEHDYAQLASIYSHTHSNFTMQVVGQTSSAALPREQPSGDSPAEWGRAVHFNAAGQPDYFVKDIAPGRKMITHVFWAPDSAPAQHRPHRED
jgi:hypothetical protein